jgi:N-acetyl-gamma-glutamyl-phosphate reductase
MLKVGVFGSTGYTGRELIDLLQGHTAVQIAFAASGSHAGGDLAEVYPGGPSQSLSSPDGVSLNSVDLVFLCLPHGASAGRARAALDAGARVIDLSADFRLKDPDTFAAWYGVPHGAPALLPDAVYGLTEWARDRLPGARLVANPGCYPTSALLPLLPLASEGAIEGTIVIDAKSGVTGAGRAPRTDMLFAERAEDLRPYAIGRAHRHVPEMEQALAEARLQDPGLIFSPHLLPVTRGLLSTIYVPLGDEWDDETIREVWNSVYAGEPFVHILPPGEAATLAHTVRTNRCALGLTVVDGMAIVTSAIDNLLKGAAGQAVQNMNVMCGFDETLGLA